jgi:branched-chain amino acid transport system permease protein
VFSQQLVNGLVTGANYAVMAIGLTLVYSILGVPNFSHGALYMLGAFLMYAFWSLGTPVVLAIGLAMIAVAGAGALIDWSTFRPMRSAPHVSLLIVSFAVGEVIQGAALLIWGPDARTIHTGVAGQVVQFGGVSISLLRLITLITAVVLIVAADQLVRRTSFGRAMRAVEQNSVGAAVSGINIDRVYRRTMAISSALAAAAGALAGLTFSIEVTMGFLPVVKAFVIVIVGGLGSIPGTIVAAVLLGISENLSSAYINSALGDVFGFAVLIIVLALRPQGLFGRKALR